MKKTVCDFCGRPADETVYTLPMPEVIEAKNNGGMVVAQFTEIKPKNVNLCAAHLRSLVLWENDVADAVEKERRLKNDLLCDI